MSTASAVQVRLAPVANTFARPLLLRTAALACIDLLSLAAAVFAAFGLWSVVNPNAPAINSGMAAAVLASLGAFAFDGLYPGIGLTAVAYLKRITRSVTFAFFLLTASMVLFKDWLVESRGGFFLSWILCMAFVPLGRSIAGKMLETRSWWGARVIVLGAGQTARTVIRNLYTNRVLGYQPVACLDDGYGAAQDCEGVPIVGRLYEAERFASVYRAQYAIVAIPDMRREQLLPYLNRWSKAFRNVVIVPGLFGVASLWTEPRDFGGVLGLEIRHNLLIPSNRVFKRAADLVLSAIGLVVSLPLIALAALLIKRASPGPAFYTQQREGRDNEPIRVWKLRTMHRDAEQMLEQHLAQDPAAREEWNRYCKLKNDPRIIPGIGDFLRKSSLDELPQLWNILIGEMSLVGPRPFPKYHNDQFPPDFQALRTQVTPGLTGLWQVSARSDGDFSVQASLDSYYIRNWSLWLDFYILIRTARVVIARNGAY